MEVFSYYYYFGNSQSGSNWRCGNFLGPNNSNTIWTQIVRLPVMINANVDITNASTRSLGYGVNSVATDERFLSDR